MTELTIDQALKQGVEAHKAGQVQEADRLYTAILKAQPKHPDANHNMGVLAVGVGKVQESLPFFKTALEANPATEQFWLSYIDALIKVDKSADAKAVLSEAQEKGAKGDAFDKLHQRLQGAEGKQLEASNAASEEDQEQPNILDSLKLDQAIKLAKKKAKDGASNEAKRIYQDILVKFPKNKRAIDGMKAVAGRSVGKASKVQDLPKNQLKFLIAQYNQGQYQEALDEILRLMQQFPNSANLHSLSGAINKACGRHDHAIENYKNVLKIIPDLAEPHYNIGNALKRKGDLEAAIVSYKKALAIKPDYVDAHNNIGNALKEQGKLEEAVEAYKKCLVIKLDYADAYHNMGATLQEQGKLEEAIEAYTKALAIQPNNAAAYNNMGNALQGVAFKRPNMELQKTIGLLLDQRIRVRPNDIASSAISLLKFEPNLQKYLQEPTIDKTEQSLQQTVLELSDLPLLLKLMSVCHLADLGLESLLKEVRTGILLALSFFESKPDALEFQSALALQCFTNEYIYDQSKDEEKAIAALEDSIETSLSKGEKPSPQAILCLASYKALHEYKWCVSLSDSKEIHQVFTRQVSEPRLEMCLKSNMPMLEEITDDVSVKVRAQYEENPYPRWLNLRLSLNPEPISKVVTQLKIKLFDNEICEVSAPNILVAGCGTGQHSIGTAARFKNSKVLAIDLSLSSLAYAKRKTEELGLTNIEYMQADILKLKKLDRQFDIIESAGVLHHMDNPMAGWKVLVDCLRDGGLMKIGLYSELARQHIVEMRKEISQSDIGRSDDDMKSFREMVIVSDEDHHKKIIVHSSDFYSLSTLRDLLFHVQEHRFTIPQLKQCLAEMGLKFCGFEDDQAVKKLILSNTGPDDPYDLDKWHQLEEADPEIFEGMYQFWCQKTA